jgi:c-di-GMP-binding flagellar brake protein YcgR
MSDKNADLLQDAILRNVKIILSLPSAGMLRNHKSRLVGELDGGILVELPRGDEALIAELIRNHTPCGVAFARGAFKVVFASSILRKEKEWRLNGQNVVAALLLEFPARIKATQRRSNYRVDVSTGSDCSVRIWRIANSELLKEQPAATKEVNAEIRNLSSGGVGVKLVGKNGAPPIIGADDRLRVVLEYDGQTLIIEGKMRRPNGTPRGDSIVTGVEFSRLERDLEGRQILARLMRIIGELQRAELHRALHGSAKKAS